jgi:hypothetical protein
MTTTPPPKPPGVPPRTREDVARRHTRAETSDGTRVYCTSDNQDWPCDAIWLLRQLNMSDMARPVGRP